MCVTINDIMSSPIIISIALFSIHIMQINYADSIGPNIALPLEGGKQIPYIKEYVFFAPQWSLAHPFCQYWAAGTLEELIRKSMVLQSCCKG